MQLLINADIADANKSLLLKLTGRSIKTPIGTTEAMSVKVLLRIFFSFSVNSSPTSALLTKPVAAATSIARS